MLILASLRTRWASLVTTIVALAFGVGLVAAMGLVLAGTVGTQPRAPQRYATAPVVVRPVDTVRVATRHGERSEPLVVPRGLAPELVVRLSTLGPAVPDRYVPAQLAHGGAAQVGRPWSVAAFSTHRLRAGRAPVGDDEVVVWAGAAEPGERVTVLTVDGPRRYTVAGVLAPARFERALFFTDAEAARLSPQVDALVLAAPPGQARNLAGADARVLTGAALRGLDPDAAADREALVAANALVGTAGGIAVFMSVFVVASTFAYAVAQRRRELALLRMAGATPGRVRRMVLAEGAAVGVLAASAGCLLGWRAAPRLAARLIDLGFAPDWFTVPATRVPLVVAAGTGLVAAMAGVVTAAWRAGRIRPVEALRETAVEPRAMPAWRWLCGLTVLAAALVANVGPALTAPADALKRKQYIPAVMLLVVALACLAPVLVPPAARLLGRPLRRLRGATGMLVRETALAAPRRTAATAAPVLLTVGMAVCLLGTTGTIGRAADAEERAQNGSGYLVLPAGTPGLNRAVVNGIRAVPGADVAVEYPSAVFDLEDGVALIRRPARVVDPPVLPRLPLLAGSLDDLRADTIVVDRDWGRDVGDTVHVWLADGSPAALRVVAVVREGVGGNGAFLTAAHPAGALAARARVRVRAGADPTTVAAELRKAVGGLGATVVSTGVDAAATGGVKRTGMRVVLGVALLYTGLFVAGTVLMAGRDRARDLELLRLAGATTGQRLRVVAAEAAFVVTVGVFLALLAAVLALGPLWLALLRLTGAATAVALPWGAVGGTVAAVTAVALLAAVVSSCPVSSARGA